MAFCILPALFLSEAFMPTFLSFCELYCLHCTPLSKVCMVGQSAPPASFGFRSSSPIVTSNQVYKTRATTKSRVILLDRNLRGGASDMKFLVVVALLVLCCVNNATASSEDRNVQLPCPRTVPVLLWPSNYRLNCQYLCKGWPF